MAVGHTKALKVARNQIHSNTLSQSYQDTSMAADTHHIIPNYGIRSGKHKSQRLGSTSQSPSSFVAQKANAHPRISKSIKSYSDEEVDSSIGDDVDSVLGIDTESVVNETLDVAKRQRKVEQSSFRGVKRKMK